MKRERTVKCLESLRISW